MNCMIVAGSIQGTWMFIPDDMRSSIPHNVVSGLTVAVLALGIAGRIIKQESHKDVGQSNCGPDGDHSDLH
jgi:hypothetical protein